MSNTGVPQEASKCTYFYVFADRDGTDGNSAQSETAEVAPDRAVREAFRRLHDQYNNAIVHFDPSSNLRHQLGIESLPAFAISAKEFPLGELAQDQLAKLPPMWKIWKFQERKHMIESEKHVPTVEREIISLYKPPDSLYQFIRDLHLRQIDYGILEASRKVESEIRKIGGRKLLNAVAFTKSVFLK